MTAPADLLPPSASPTERTLSVVLGGRADLPVPLRPLWDPASCPLDILPWLAWALSVDEWDPRWSEEARRAVVSSALAVHRHKGTVASIRRAIAAAGYGDSMLIEGNSGTRYDGAYDYDGSRTYGDPTEWARYRFVLDRPITNPQAAQVRRLLARVAPARCELIELIFIEAAHSYDGTISYDGLFNHGIA